jgi:hypothetical protein
VSSKHSRNKLKNPNNCACCLNLIFKTSTPAVTLFISELSISPSLLPVPLPFQVKVPTSHMKPNLTTHLQSSSLLPLQDDIKLGRVLPPCYPPPPLLTPPPPLQIIPIRPSFQPQPVLAASTPLPTSPASSPSVTPAPSPPPCVEQAAGQSWVGGDGSTQTSLAGR